MPLLLFGFALIVCALALNAPLLAIVGFFAVAGGAGLMSRKNNM